MSKAIVNFALSLSLYALLTLEYSQLLIHFRYPPAQLHINPEIPQSHSGDRN
jgi:hypothetical protein